MCAPFDSHPPIPAIAGAAVSHTHEELESRDGTRFAAFHATPDSDGEKTAVVVLPDVRGLFGFYEELALRFAERGHPAIAIDYFGRTAGASTRDEDFPYAEHVPLVTAEHVQMDVGAAVAHLREAGAPSVATVGFCFGGRHSWLSAGGGHDLLAAVGFYGNPGERNGQPGPTELAGTFASPILALMGGADAHITTDMVDEFDAALTRAGVSHEVVTYPGAPHSFFDRNEDQFVDACADAWRRTLDFIER
ncbi:MAG TPA: dienelactone hydrolase family protein [Gaiellales bacterium]|jgi:carboxymethylenebutenolidase